MYGLVLMMALTGSAETPEFGRKGGHGCSGAYGCSGYVVGCSGAYGCSGYGCSSSYGCSSGRHGGGLFGRHGCNGGGLFGKHRNRGCSSYCSGGYVCGGGYACSGAYGVCSGAYGVCSGAYGAGHVVCSGAYGAGVIHGCAGGYGCSGGVIIDAPKAPPAEKLKEMPKEKGKTGASLNQPATIVVELPADAKLLIDDAATRSTDTVRSFVTPELAPEKTFSYTLKAEIVRDGQTLTATQKVTVRAGEESRITLGADKFSATVSTK